MKNWLLVFGGSTAIVLAAVFSLLLFSGNVEELQQRAQMQESVSSILDKVEVYGSKPAEQRSLQDYAEIMEELTDLQMQAANIRPENESERAAIEEKVAAMSKQAFSQFAHTGNNQLSRLEAELTGRQPPVPSPFQSSLKSQQAVVDEAPVTALELKRRHDKILSDLGIDPKKTEYVPGSQLVIEYQNRYWSEIQSYFYKLPQAEKQEFRRLMEQL